MATRPAPMGAWYCVECDKDKDKPAPQGPNDIPVCPYCGADANFRRRGAPPSEVADIIAEDNKAQKAKVGR